MSDLSQPIHLEFKSAKAGKTAETKRLEIFNSYSFDRSILTPASPFRFTAPGVNKSDRVAIRSGDFVQLSLTNSSGETSLIATGFVDETDTHVIPANVDYVITGRDTLGQLVDNASIDASNSIINTENVTMETLLKQLLRNTRIPQQIISQQMPNAALLVQTQAGETKINTLQRYMEFLNILIWSLPDGRVVIGKPDFTNPISGSLILNSSSPQKNNLLEARSRRNLNQAIRQIVTQLSTLEQVDAGSFTVFNNDDDMAEVQASGVGKSIYRSFNYGEGSTAANSVKAIGNQTGEPRTMGRELSMREIARDNMKILDVEVVVMGHVNESGVPYNIDQIYNVEIEDDDVNEPMYVYAVNYELTMQHGMLTRLKLCRLGTIIAYADALRRG